MSLFNKNNKVNTEESEQQREKRDMEERLREAELQKEKEERLCKKIDDDITKDGVCCVHTSDWDLKQVALKHMLKNGYVCVQNDVTATKYTTYFILTIVRKEYEKRFLNK